MASATLSGKRAQEARDLYDAGLGCNAIARKMSVNPATVSRWAKAEGIKFDRSQVAMAVRAHVVDLAEARTLLAQKMVVVASEMLDRLDEPYLVYSFGGQFNDFASHTLEQPPVEVVRNALTAAGIAFDKASKVVEGENPGQSAAASLLTGLADLMGVTGPTADA